jgi:lysine N6-hydroxylase
LSITYDFIAVGVGPFNLGLACLTEPIEELNGLFLDSKPQFDWHRGMLLQAAELQTPFMSDLVTMADPTSPFSFLNYLKERGRLYPFYIRTSLFPLRAEFKDYFRWAAAKLSNVLFGHQVTEIAYDEAEGLYAVHVLITDTGQSRTFRGRRLVIGVGTPPHIPSVMTDVGGDRVHSSNYLHAKKSLQEKQTITIIGSGQSAAEIYYDLLHDIDSRRYTLNWVTRSARFFPLDYTKLTLELTSPEYVDYFYSLPADTRDGLLPRHKELYKGISASLIDSIFDLLYVKSRIGRCPTRLLTNTELRSAAYDETQGLYTLTLRQQEQGTDYALSTEGLVLATGYDYRIPEFLESISHRISWDEKGRFAVARNYSIDFAGDEIFVQNAELHTHGFVTPDLGMAAYRNSYIINELLGKEYYPVERSVAFQDFTAALDTVVTSEAQLR